MISELIWRTLVEVLQASELKTPNVLRSFTHSKICDRIPPGGSYSSLRGSCENCAIMDSR